MTSIVYFPFAFVISNSAFIPTEIPQKDFIELTKEVAKTWRDKDEQVIALENEVSRLGEYTEELNAKINYLGKQIAIDRGEIEEDDTNEYELAIKQPEETLDEPAEGVIPIEPGPDNAPVESEDYE